SSNEGDSVTIRTNEYQNASVAGDRYSSNEQCATIGDVTSRERHHLSESAWNYLWTGTGDETTLARNSSKFDELLWNVPLFAGVDRPRTDTSLLGFDLSVPVFVAPFGQDAVFHPEGHLAVGRAAESVDVEQMVPVASSFT